jgi:hypothetical protein
MKDKEREGLESLFDLYKRKKITLKEFQDAVVGKSGLLYDLDKDEIISREGRR